MNYLRLTSSIVSALQNARPIALKHLLAKSGHLWALISASTFYADHCSVDSVLSNETSALFEGLIPNLRDKNHFCRLHTLQIVASFPRLPLVVDHADLDF